MRGGSAPLRSCGGGLLGGEAPSGGTVTRAKEKGKGHAAARTRGSEVSGRESGRELKGSRRGEWPRVAEGRTIKG